MTSRALTPDEIALARSVFGNAIAYDRVRIHQRKYWWFQPKRTTMAPNGAIWFHPRGNCYCDDFCTSTLESQGLFIHEMVHVWQHQQGVNLLLKRHPFMRYDYSIKPGWRLSRYNLEQQAEIVRHYFLLKNGFPLAGAPPLAVYEGLLPFRAE